ncbi:hypothetical protein FSP39_017369 [Pinctada imbricata]|uniref:RING-type domain-containing protein n=1 Tax=Pinctada imbricata TaxID=66713 RepID=A0AA89BRA0_PINIB|nr:hypothetical protein FSP39_017369 [Pinctada imbricata]
MMNLEDYEVTEEYGFVMPKPLEKLPREFDQWNDLAEKAPELTVNKEFRQKVDKMPLLDHNNLKSHEEKRLAHLQLSAITMCYVWQEGDKGVAKVLPRSVAIPYCAISEDLGVQPIISHVSLVLANWKLKDKNGNITTLYNCMPGDEEAEWFSSVTAQIELDFAPAIKMIGGSAAQSSTMQCFDVAFGVEHETVLDSGDKEVVSSYNNCIQAASDFRSYHIQIITKYIIVMARQRAKDNDYESVAEQGTGGSNMEHELNLQSLCRLCCVKIPINSKSYNKENYKSAISSLYSIDIDYDLVTVHPPKICAACRLRVTRYKQSEDEFVDMNLPELFDFKPHTSVDCEICTSKVGRPKKKAKRKQTIPSITQKSVNIAQEHSYTAPNKQKESALKQTESQDKQTQRQTKSQTETQTESSNLDKLNVTDPFLVESGSRFRNIVIRSIPVERFSNPLIAQTYICTICRGVPCVPNITKCGHIFCSECLSGWLSVSCTCPFCRSLVDETTDVFSLTGQLLSIFDTLTVICSHDNCSKSFPIGSIDEHEASCPQRQTAFLFNLTTKPKIFKLPLHSITAKHAKRREEISNKTPLQHQQ